MIHLEQLTKKFKQHTALQQIDLHIQHPSIVGVVGKNGAGKSTLLKSIAGFLRPTSGNIRIWDVEPFNHLMISANSIFIDEHTTYPNSLSLGEIIQVGAQFYPSWNANLALELLRHFELSASMYYEQLSKGNKSVFNIIVGISARLPLTIFDEPTAGMDRNKRHDFYRLILKEYVREPRAILISTHFIDEIEHLLEDIILIDGGKLLLHLPIDRMREYALTITGDQQVVEEWIDQSDILYQEGVHESVVRVIVKNKMEYKKLQKRGLHIAKTSVADLADYITRRETEGIDHVIHSAYKL